MSLRRVNPKRDRNEKPVVAALNQAGVVTYRLSSADLPDLLCGYRGRYFLVEVKSAKGRLEPGQVAFHATQTALGLPCYVVRSVDEALGLLGADPK
jgi:hypothetical protein